MAIVTAYGGVQPPKGKPPQNLEALCENCLSTLRTTDSEEEYSRAVVDGKAGWIINCPNCNLPVFFAKPADHDRRPWPSDLVCPL